MADSDPQDLRHTIVQNVPPAMVLAILAVLARFESRRLKRGGIAWHDIFIVLGLLGSLLQSALVIVAASQGIGLHIWEVSDANLRVIFILEWVAKIDYALTFTFIKISILLLYRSIFQGRGFAIATHVVMGYVVAWGIAVVLVSIFSCTPVNGFWDVNIPSTCVSSIQFFAWTTITNILGDVLILALPMRRVWKLQMNTKQKAAVSGMFLLGGFVVLATVIRLIYMEKMDVTDATWTYVQPAIWFTVELNIGVISACLPTLRPLVQRLWPAALASTVASFLSRSTHGRSRGNSKSGPSGGPSSGLSSDKPSKVSKHSQNSDTTTSTNGTIVEYDYSAEKGVPSSSVQNIISPLTSPTQPYSHPHSPTITITTSNPSSATTLAFPPAAKRHHRKSSASASASSAKSLLSRLRRPSTSTSSQPTPHSPEPPIPITTLTPSTPTTSIFTPSSIASVPMMPACVPTPAPGPGCFQPEDAERRLSRGCVASWHNYAISNAGITDTGALGVDFEGETRWGGSRFEGVVEGVDEGGEGEEDEEERDVRERRNGRTMWNVSEGEESRSRSRSRNHSHSQSRSRSWSHSHSRSRDRYGYEGIGLALGGEEEDDLYHGPQAVHGRWA